MIRALLILFVIAFTQLAQAEPILNFGLGYGKTTQEFGTNEFTGQSLGGHVDLNYRFWAFVVGLGYMTVARLNLAEDRNYVAMYSAHAGIAVGRYIEILGGVGAGKFRKQKSELLTTPADEDYIAKGVGYMAGVRLHLIQTKDFSLGVSGTYYRMVSDEYDYIADGSPTTRKEESRATGSVAAILFTWYGGKAAGKIKR